MSNQIRKKLTSTELYRYDFTCRNARFNGLSLLISRRAFRCIIASRGTAICARARALLSNNNPVAEKIKRASSARFARSLADGRKHEARLSNDLSLSLSGRAWRSSRARLSAVSERQTRKDPTKNSTGRSSRNTPMVPAGYERAGTPRARGSTHARIIRERHTQIAHAELRAGPHVASGPKLSPG